MTNVVIDDPPHPVEGGSANDYDYANGDPINQFDPSGLGPCPPFLHRTRSDGSHYCKGNAAASVAKDVYEHVDVSAGVCVIGCVTYGIQGGTPYIQRGAGLAVGGGVTVGVASKEYKNRACENVVASGGPFYVAADGAKTDGWKDAEAGVGLTVGGGAAIMRSSDDKYCGHGG